MKVADRIDIWYCTWTGLPKNVTQLAQIPRTKAIQLSSGRYSRSFERIRLC